ncbi:MAG: arylsulfatase [Lentisphaeraceae bacterium]|nr:arylsulfatase [Lentisphaeraceae bacterium]
MCALKKIILSLSFLLCLTSFADERPNIILVLVDDMGYSDLGAFGNEIKTPNIDSLAAKGIKFTNFTNCAKCETTRTTLMSGRYHTEVMKKPETAITIPENLGLAGYQNFMVGKWHVFDTPYTRGFDRFFGFLNGAVNFFTGESTKAGEWHWRIDDKPFDIPKDFYSTTAFTDYANKFIEERDKKKPFFMYLAHNAPHYPLQAPKEEVMKYRGKYKEGWEVLRQKRFNRMKELDIIPQETQLSAPEANVRKWDSLSEEEKDWQDLKMATYAAMVDTVDQSVGKVINKLKEENIFENTLIIFLSDNGACPFERTTDITNSEKLMPWDPKSFHCYSHEWANACNTPWRMYKQNQNEGGIATSMIAHWPKGITVPGTFNRQRGHLIDFHATFRDLAGAKYPSEYKGNKIGPALGISLVPAFTGKERKEHDFIYQNFSNKYTALVMGKWKLVDRKYLYNLENDRIESNDLSKSNPEKFKQMLTEWKKRDAELNKYSKKKRKK